jgi:hypothetical protein
MSVAAVLLLAVLGASVLGLRAAGDGPRWPFLIASTISGTVLLALVIAWVIAVATGRDSWNTWVSGTQQRETVTLWLVLVVGPILLATSCVSLVIGLVLRTRQRRRSWQAPHQRSR